MSSVTVDPVVRAIHPQWAVEGGRLRIEGSHFPMDEPRLPGVRIGDQPARVVAASSNALTVLVPPGLEGGRTTVRIDAAPGETGFVEIGVTIATGLHQVDNPAFDREGRLYVTYSGSRGQQVPVSIFRIDDGGARQPFVSGIVNPTSMVFGPDECLYVSSRFEGTVYRVQMDGSYAPFATDLGMACGLAFARDGALLVGDRSGTIFRVTEDGHATAFATVPSSVAAFHLAMGPDACLYVTGPTLAPYDHVYRIEPDGRVETLYSRFGRPQGLAFDANGVLYVVEALAGESGLCRLHGDGSVEQVVASPGLVGLAMDPDGGLVVTSNETAYRLEVGLRPLGATVEPGTYQPAG